MLILGMLVIVTSALQAQSVTNPLRTIDKDQVYGYVKAADLNKNEYVVSTFYITDFLENARLTVQIDTASVAADLPKVRAIIMRSANNSDWYSSVGDTVSVLSTTASGHKTGTKLISSVYENYLKVTITAIDSTQNTKLRYYLLFDKN